jgi:hypothetical protein
MGGGGSNRTQTESTTNQIVPPGLEGAYSSAGGLASGAMDDIGQFLSSFLHDQSVQQVAGPTGAENLAYGQQMDLMQGQGPQAWSDAMGMFNALGNLPQWGGANLSGITGWGANPNQAGQVGGGGSGAPQTAMAAQQQQYNPYGGSQGLGNQDSQIPSTYQYGGGGAGGGTGASATGGGSGYQSAGPLGNDPALGQSFAEYFQSNMPDLSNIPEGPERQAARTAARDAARQEWGAIQQAGGNPNITPGTAGSSGFNIPEPGGADVPWTQASQQGGIPGQAQSGGIGSGTVREIDEFDFGGFMDKLGRGGGGGSGNFNFSSGPGKADFQALDREVNPLSNIDFANHPALKSALDAFTKTSLPGIENSMIGAGLGRSGAAGNAIATGKAQMALPVMQQLMNLEMQNKGLDVSQRGQDYQAKAAADMAARQAAASGASLAQQRYLADQAFAAQMRGQDIGMRQQDIGLRGQDINALLQQSAQGLQARGQDINALMGGAQGLMGAGSADLARIQQGIAGGMGMGEQFRNIYNQQGEAEFTAGQRPWDRAMQLLGPILGGAMGAGGQQTNTTGTGGGGK